MTMRSMRALLQPGQFIRLAGQPDWGVGQVQSVTGDRVTANFPDAGKVVLRTGAAVIEVVDDAPAAGRG